MSDAAKLNAARAALDYIKDGMTLGLGSGSTAAHFVRLLGERVRGGLKVRGVPTSEETRKLAEHGGIPLVDLSDVDYLDLDVDGADEVDPHFRLIKGGGGALLREKIVAAASRDMIVIADAGKAVEALGAFPLPIEVIPFGHHATCIRALQVLAECRCANSEITLRRKGGAPFVTDNGNYVMDARVDMIPDPDRLAQTLKGLTGVVEHGLFIGLARTVILGTETGVEIRSL
ncbi:MAG: ribose-5-phosphate isomerase RpiA [Terricaulis silvestris]